MHVHPTLAAPDAPTSPEDAVIGLLMQAGRRLRTRHPEDQVDPSTFPLAKQLMCHDAMRVSDLAAQVELDASTVSRQIKQLEDKGIVERTTDPADRRASLVRLTEHGRTSMESAFRRRRDRIKAALEPWSDSDRALLQDLLTRLAADLREANERETSALQGNPAT
ncbi:MAG: MarR family transcriptional regulator [Actinomycetota bacterium]|jgi:DNA-binding MarR family transcriptional regulator|nr:MarR family transcriptional regulator [Actinomycetota bacterium]